MSAEKSEKECRAIEELLGWHAVEFKESEEVKLVLVKGEGFEIKELRNDDRIYFLNLFAMLSLQEAQVLKQVLESLKSKKGLFHDNIELSLSEYCVENFVELSREQHSRLLEILECLVQGFGVFSKLLQNENIEEIAVIGLGREKPVLVFEKNFGWLKTNFYYCDEAIVRNTVNKMARALGRRLSLQTPRLNAVLPDGSRLHSAINPISFLGPSITVRKFRKQPFTPSELVKNKTASAEAMAFLHFAMQTSSSIIVSGNTGSGKTTLLNALFYFVPENERIIVIEETPEINLRQKHVVKLNVVEGLEIGMKDLIVDSLRMRPDRVIVGEVRNEREVQAFIDTILAGQGKGSYASFHAQSALETLSRLKNLGVQEMDLNSIDLIVVQKRWTAIDLKKKLRKEVRKIVEIAEVFEEKGKLELGKLFEFNFKKNSLVKAGESVKVLEKIMQAYSASRKQVKKMLKEKERELSGK